MFYKTKLWMSGWLYLEKKNRSMNIVRSSFESSALKLMTNVNRNTKVFM